MTCQKSLAQRHNKETPGAWVHISPTLSTQNL